MDPAVPLLPLDVVALHPSGGESHSDTGILKTSAECLQGSGEQPIITMYELNKSAARDFQTFVVVSVEAEARLISQQAVSGSQHRCGDRGAVVGRVVVNDHDLELDALLFEDATQTALDGGAVLYIGMHTEISGFAGFTDTTLDASPGTTWRLRD